MRLQLLLNITLLSKYYYDQNEQKKHTTQRPNPLFICTFCRGGVTEPNCQVRLSSPLHTSLARAYGILEPFFGNEYCKSQSLLTDYLSEVSSFFFNEKQTNAFMEKSKSKEITWENIKSTAKVLFSAYLFKIFLGFVGC